MTARREGFVEASTVHSEQYFSVYLLMPACVDCSSLNLLLFVIRCLLLMKLTAVSVASADAHRALELLEDYHSQLTNAAERPLRSAIERVIRIFKSRLFQALLGKLSQIYQFKTICCGNE